MPDRRGPPGAGLGDLITGTETIGRFIYAVADHTWWCSPAIYLLHGLPLDTEITTDLVMSFKHPDDRTPAIELLAKVALTGEPFCFPHRIIDVAGHEHSTVILGDATRTARGAIELIQGFAVDLTEGHRRYSLQIGAAAVRAATEHRAAIEQAKGALMLAYGINPEAAFALLRWHSQRHNTKLNQIAESLIAVLQRTDRVVPASRDAMDKLLHDLAAGRHRTGTAGPR
ncbi:ANTAR domain-containing protein [Kribbella pittospori]|uniref:ANTAR domain-containing protein n=1 Tax=Kribbella pittospori TaxID=722689 RepID=A0A4R0JYE5_9ACTN|nr:ANTAR domain-containing protein [Kribbella pittospori]TCC50376.1 ANTAR domain-containing protein [Kribbella pittospori]